LASQTPTGLAQRVSAISNSKVTSTCFGLTVLEMR
jgi:hypothetical protein